MMDASTKLAIETELTLKNVSVSFPIYQTSSLSLKKRLLFRGTGGLNCHRCQPSNRRGSFEACLSVSKGRNRVALVGSNAGKTTLLRVMAGVYEPSREWLTFTVEYRRCLT